MVVRSVIRGAVLLRLMYRAIVIYDEEKFRVVVSNFWLLWGDRGTHMHRVYKAFNYMWSSGQGVCCMQSHKTRHAENWCVITII